MATFNYRAGSTGIAFYPDADGMPTAALDGVLSMLPAFSQTRVTGRASRRRAEAGHGVCLGDKLSVSSAA
ncbi:MAG: hypothetical protein OEU26_17010 [Candidatus Tectomicrobia bacterium]|nr:hypothetical protein [Candidatus Tectomicrobia bacterium]